MSGKMATMLDYWETHAEMSAPELSDYQLVFAAPVRAVAIGRTVLDCGSGAGALSAYLQDRAQSVVGVDFSGAMVRRARAFFPHVQFHHADVLTTDFGRRFDIICGSAFLHEISCDDTPALIAFLNRHLAPGGFCWFQENSFFNPFARFLRNHVVGKYGVPKYGSEREMPFDPERWRLYQQQFRYATRSAEAFVAFQRIWTYLVRCGPYEPWWVLDSICSRLPKRIKLCASYIQHIYLSHDVPKRDALAL